jgi:hypothetical protein
VVALDAIVRVLAGVVDRGGEQLLDDMAECLSQIGDHLCRLAVCAEDAREEPAGRGDIPAA